MKKFNFRRRLILNTISIIIGLIACAVILFFNRLTTEEKILKQTVDQYQSYLEIYADNIWWFKKNKTNVESLLKKMYPFRNTAKLMDKLYTQFEITTQTDIVWEFNFDEKSCQKGQQKIDQIKQLQKYLRHQWIKAKDAWWWHNCYNMIIWGTVKYDLHCPKDKTKAILESIFSQYKIRHIGANN